MEVGGMSNGITECQKETLNEWTQRNMSKGNIDYVVSLQSTKVYEMCRIKHSCLNVNISLQLAQCAGPWPLGPVTTTGTVCRTMATS